MTYFDIDGEAWKHFELDLMTASRMKGSLERGEIIELAVGDDSGFTAFRVTNGFRVVLTTPAIRSHGVAGRSYDIQRTPRGFYEVRCGRRWEGNYRTLLAAVFGCWVKNFTDYEARYAVPFAD